MLGPIGASFMAGWSQMDMFFLASWISVPILIDITNPDGTTEWLQFVLSNLTFMVAVLGAMVAAGWTFVKLGMERLKNLGGRLVVLMVINIAGAPTIALLDTGIREASIGLLKQVGITATSTVATIAVAGIAPPILILIGIIAIVAVMIQWGIMIARSALVPVLVGAWPLAASVATLGGQAATKTFNSITAWLLAFVVYILPAAIVYAAAFRLKSGYDGLGGIMYGFVLEVIAVFMLPALLRILAPQVGKIGSAFGGKIAMEGAISLAETAITVGAVVLTAGAASGMLAGAGAAGAGGAGAGGGGSGAGAAPGSASGTAGAAEPAAAAGAPSEPDGAAEQHGAAGMSAETAEPSSESGTGAVTEAPSTGSDPSSATAPTPTSNDPAQQPPAPSPPAPKRAPGNPQAGYYGAQQAAQTLSGNAARSARTAINDADDIIGGKHE
ncbi:hypothetical protein [Plantibacter sp. RU18]|uniref:hypothetical protein n=1 Tax=Plantibacter sp. RU18 TaxID=3158143 RepID=UPI003D3632DD